MMFFSHRICGDTEERTGASGTPPTPTGPEGQRGAGAGHGMAARLTSDRKVWADFWAPTCSRYS